MGKRPLLAAYLTGLVVLVLVAWAVLSSLWDTLAWLVGWRR